MNEVEKDVRAFVARLDQARANLPPPPPQPKVEITQTKFVERQPAQIEQNQVIVQNPNSNGQ